MFIAFQNLIGSVRGSKLYPSAEQYRIGAKRNIDIMVNYYQKNNFAVLSDHILVRILGSIPISLGNDVRNYYDAVFDSAYDYAGAMFITSPNHAGKPTDTPWLYGKGNVELPVALHEYRNTLLDYNEANHYGTLEQRAVRILRHPRSDLAVEIPDGNGKSDETGLVIYLIDIPTLCTQYRAFRLDQLAKTSEDTMGAKHFVHRYILPSLIEDHCNVAFANRLINRFYTDTLGTSSRRKIVGLAENQTRINELQEEVLEYVVSRKLSYAELFESIPLLTPGMTYKELFKLPNTLTTRQCNWALYLAQLPYLDFLMTLDSLHDGDINNGTNNRLKRELTYAKNDGAFRQYLPRNFIIPELDSINQLLAL